MAHQSPLEDLYPAAKEAKVSALGRPHELEWLTEEGHAFCHTAWWRRGERPLDDPPAETTPALASLPFCFPPPLPFFLPLPLLSQLEIIHSWPTGPLPPTNSSYSAALLEISFTGPSDVHIISWSDSLKVNDLNALLIVPSFSVLSATCSYTLSHTLGGPGGHMMQRKSKCSTFFILTFDLWLQEQDLWQCWQHLTWSDGGEQQDHRSRKRDQDGHVDAVDQKSNPLTEAALRKRRTAKACVITSSCRDYSNKTGARKTEREELEAFVRSHLENNNSWSFSAL